MPYAMDEAMPSFDGGISHNGVQQKPSYTFATGSRSDSEAFGRTLENMRWDMHRYAKAKFIFAKAKFILI